MPHSLSTRPRALILALVLVAATRAFAADTATTIDGIVTRLYATFDPQALQQLDDAKVQSFLTPEERATLSTQYSQFDTDIPVTVSIVRDTAQTTVPFWIAEAGFKHTDYIFKNEESTFEVWQKNFPAGHIGLGINGFDGHRFHYFVVVTPQESGKTPKLSNFVPANQTATTCAIGATVYLDWTELVLTEVPESLVGGILLQTHRGRAREAHLVGAFRITPYPATDTPDEVILNWSADPTTTQSISWRTAKTVASSALRYREAADAKAAFTTKNAAQETLNDRMLANNPVSFRYSVTLDGLKPGTAYSYQIGDPATDKWIEAATFTTAPASSDTFSFALLSDTHNKELAGKLFNIVSARTPHTALTVIAGDLVDTGVFQDDWDKFFGFMSPALRTTPVLPVMGNHDDQGGYGLPVYSKQFVLADPQFAGIKPESCYTVRYANALFLMISVGVDRNLIKDYVDRELAKSDATWKFLVYHFPPYSGRNENEPFDEVLPVLDKYHVDFMLTGHTHRYFRSKPIRANKEVESPNDGTVYIVAAPRLYQTFDITGNKCVYQSWNEAGEVKDTYTIEK